MQEVENLKINELLVKVQKLLISPLVEWVTEIWTVDIKVEQSWGAARVKRIDTGDLTES